MFEQILLGISFIPLKSKQIFLKFFTIRHSLIYKTIDFYIEDYIVQWIETTKENHPENSLDS